MAAAYLITKRGSLKIVDENNSVFEYSKKSSKAVIWRCENRYNGCKAIIHTSLSSYGSDEPDIVFRSERVCDHPNDASKVAARQAMSQLKLSIERNASLDTTRQKVNETVSSIDTNTRMQLPSLNVMSRSIRKWRNRAVNTPALPQDRAGFIIPDSIAKFQDGSNFLVYDSGSNDTDRILIFSSNYGLKALASATYIATDGTFKLSPSLWTQIITVHGVYAGFGSIPFVFGLLPNKKQETYLRFFNALKECIPGFSPTNCLSDFEVGLQNSVKIVFPNIEVHGCLFHLSQSVHRKICELGLKGRYNTDKTFQLKIKSFCALAFIPESDVVLAFEGLTDDIDIPSEFVTYFESTYIGSIQGRGNRQKRSSPTFPIQTWNVTKRVAADLPRSNNSIEGFHSALKSSITSTHPNIWKLCTSMKGECSRSETKNLHRLRGDQIVQKKTYVQLTERIKRVLSQYDPTNCNVRDFLTNLANVIG